MLANYNVYPLITEAQPHLNEDETAVESTPKFRNGEWHQTWTVRKLTKKEIREKIKDIEKTLSEGNVADSESAATFLADKELQEQRYNMCKSCDSFTALKSVVVLCR